MSFQTGLSGLNASSRSLDVIGHNIANANTTGMKSSRAEFSAMYSSMLGYGGNNNNGIGVEVGAVAQQFTQGSLSTTNNSLDVAINGNGFFQLTLLDGTKAYTRDGSFKLDKDGYLKTNAESNVMGFPTDDKGVPTSVTLQPIKLPTSAPIAAKKTENVRLRMNLDAEATPAAAAIPPTPRSTYGTSINVYDAQGVASPVNMYFEKTATANEWEVFFSLDTTAFPSGSSAYKITFNADGTIATATPAPATTPPDFAIEIPAGTIASLNPNETTGLIQDPIVIDLGKSDATDATAITQYGTKFAIADLTQDGYTAGELTGINIGEDGVISARYSNGQTQAAGQLALADFRNSQGLAQLGGNAWAETFESGQPISGAPSTGKFGALRSGALEDSNVELTQELVNMMTAQRAYQANAQTIKTQDQIMSTLVNLK